MCSRIRDSRFELLRIIAFTAITLNHVPCSSFQSTPEINLLLRNVYYLGGQFGVNLFVIIGAWFLVDKDFRSERIIKILCQACFYAILLDVVSLILGRRLSFSFILLGFKYWFLVGYVFMSIIGPIIKRIKMKYKILFSSIGFVLASVVTALGSFDTDIMIVKLFSKGLFIGPAWFTWIFVFVDLIKKVNYERFKIHFIFLFASCYLIMFSVTRYTNSYYIREVCSPVCFFAAFGLFMFVKSYKEIHFKAINKISSVAFGMYLFQQHTNFRDFFWEGLFHFTSVSEKTLFYGPLSLLALIVIWCAAFVIDALFNKIYKIKRVNKMINDISKKVDELYYKICGKICCTQAC